MSEAMTMFYEDGYTDDDFESLLQCPTVKKDAHGIRLFVVPTDAIMPEQLARSFIDDNETLRRLWCDKVNAGFRIGSELALQTMQIAAKNRRSGTYILGSILRAAIDAEQMFSLEYVARGFICTTVQSSISGRAALAKRAEKLLD